jgi:replication factor C subunit 3/5
MDFNYFNSNSEKTPSTLKIDVLVIAMSNNATVPWTEKYRPRTLDDIIDHDKKITTLRSLVASNQLPHLLFYGPPGSGKTSMILALARDMYGANYRRYISEINGSSERGIDTIRGNVVDFVEARADQVKLMILDEADALTGEAQGALKSVMEKYHKYARFCLICNDINKISPALQSRCVRMVFSALNPTIVKDKLREIVKEEGVDITDDGLDSLISLQRDFRQLLNELQKMHYYNSALGRQITSDEVYQSMGKPTAADVTSIINVLFKGTFQEAKDHIMDLYLSSRVNMVDLVSFILKRVTTLSKLDITQKFFLIQILGQIDSHTRTGCNAEIQIALLVSAFLRVRAEAQDV